MGRPGPPAVGEPSGVSLDDLTALGSSLGVPAPPSVGAEIAAMADEVPPPPVISPEQPKAALLSGGPEAPLSARQSHLDFRVAQPEATAFDVRRVRPGATPRQSEIMAATSYEQVANALQPDDDPIRTGARSVAFEVYSDHVQGSEAAQVDFARFDQAVQSGLVEDEASKALWNKVLSGQLLSETESGELATAVSSFADTLDGSPSDDLTVGLAGRVTRVQKVSDGLAVQVSHPLGWDDGSAALPEVRRERLQKLNLSALAEQGRANIERMLSLAQMSDMAPIDGDGLDPFLGVVMDLDEPVADKTVEAAYADLASQFGMHPDDAKGMVRAAWESLITSSAGSWGDGAPFALPAEGGGNPVVDAILGRTEGPFSLLTPGNFRLPKEVLESPSGDGMTSTALPDGTVVYAAPISDDAAMMARHLYPGVVGADRVPRWIPSTPMKVQDASRVRRLQAEDASFENFVNSDLAGVGGHPLFKAGNYVTFSIPNDGPPPVGAQVLGRVTAEQPGLSLERLSASDLNPNELLTSRESPLNTHRWAAFDGQTADKSWVARLRRAGYKTVPTETGELVFGITQAAAEAAAPEGVSVTTNDGGDGGPRAIRLGGETVVWDPQEWIDDTPAPPRRGSAARRYELAVPKGSDPAQVAKGLLAAGAKHLSVYAHAKYLDGFERAYETAYDDGVEMIVTRHAEGDLASPHGGPVFVPKASGLPAGVSDIAGLEPSPEFAPDEADLIPAVKNARQAGKSKVAGFDLVGPDGLKRPPTLAKTRDGIPVPKPRRDKPNTQWEVEFGVEFDPAFRVGNEVREIPSDVQDRLRSTFSTFADEPAIQRFSVSRITVSYTPDGLTAATEWQPGGAIVLSRDADPQALPAALRAELEAIAAAW